MRASASSSVTRRWASSYSRACSIDCATWAAIASSRSISRVVERAWLARAEVERALELLAHQDRDGEDRLVLVLVQVGERLEARVEVRLRRDHHRLALGGRRAGDALAGAHARPPRHLLDARPVRRAQDELVRALVVEVDEARVGLERVRGLARDELEHLLQVERRVDRGDRLGQQAQVPLGLLHRPIIAIGHSCRAHLGTHACVFPIGYG